MIVILGAGIAGLSAGYHLNLRDIPNEIYESKDTWGGLLDNFCLKGGFRFDYFVHLSFTNNKYVQDIFSRSSEYFSHRPNPYNYYKGKWLKHPAQNNLVSLTVEEKVNIILDFVKRPVIKRPKNYYEWLTAQYGNYFSNNFPDIYSRKYWTMPASQLNIDWLGSRFSLPLFEDLLKGAFEEQKKNHYYADEMRYPKKGGYKSFLSLLAEGANIKTHKHVDLIDLSTKRIYFRDGSDIYYEKLISSIPLTELVKLIKDIPKSVAEAGEKLLYTSGQLVSLGFARPDIPQYLWFYIYDQDIYPARAYSPSLKSHDNVPVGKSSLQFETYFSQNSKKKLCGGSLIEHIVKNGEKLSMWKLNDIEEADYREVPYANVVFNFDRKKNIEIIHRFLKAQNVFYIGRFGEWDYLWSDQSLLSGYNCACKI